MVAAVASSSVGDSVYGEDDNSNSLEKRVAQLTGKEDAMYVVSGTMSNQIAIRSHLYQPPHSVLCDYRSHIYTAEAAGLAILSQSMVTPVHPKNSVHLTLEDVKRSVILGEDVHTAPTRVISLENTLGGTILPIEEIKRISEFARSHNIKMHLDGARLWNASAATDISLEEYGKYFDTISLCLSKGMGAPVGSILVGPKDLIKKARWLRKQQGGGIRQAGWLTTAANIAIDEVWPTMKATHAKAAKLGSDLEAIGVHFQLPIQTNFLFIDSAKSGLDLAIFSEEAKNAGVKVWGERLVLHHQTSDLAIDNLKTAISKALKRSHASAETSSAPTGAYRTRMTDN
ncbi:threonine aldolase GLY1 [Sugiyamaella lignohabitans]|uniref:low-specificity L-threonine aldolase n=1 Tax=Sugiyamaella lignohabitans TaxID=796027 RepID=A0A161HIB9_9ASCO|nr:threonine aldolase GLY1 [Sugiyamaella lignohabitans]ANB12207.1 threonine aldolase GLY1 [Sugiyamaella lignohabitans]